MKKSMKNMMLEILDAATEGRDRKPAEILYIAESMNGQFYRWYLDGLYTAFKCGSKTAAQVLETIMHDLKAKCNNTAAMVARTIELVTI